MKLNTIGADLAKITGVTAITDVTGFGLLGHLLEICQGSSLSATINISDIPLLDSAVLDYLKMGCVPGGSTRNWQSIHNHVTGIKGASTSDIHHQALLCDPQTSGGLLVAVDTESADAVSAMLAAADCYHLPIGSLSQAAGDNHIQVAS